MSGASTLSGHAGKSRGRLQLEEQAGVMQIWGELQSKRGLVGPAQSWCMPGLWMESTRSPWGKAYSEPWPCPWPPFLASAVASV